MTEFALKVLQLILSSLFVFLILSFLIEGVIALFNITNYRLRSICRLLPIFKLPLFFIVPFIDLNILSCDSLIKPYIRSFFSDISNKHSLPKHLGLILPEYLVILFVIATATIFLYRLLQMIYAYREVYKIVGNAKGCNRKNGSILSTLLVSDNIPSPLAYGLNTILLPSYLVNQFTEEEYNAVLAHEFEHLRWYDPTVKGACFLIKSLFWWIPMNKQLERIEADQEKACDEAISNYACVGTDLASAIHKTLKYSKQKNFEPGFSYLAKNPTVERIESLIYMKKQPLSLLSICGAIITIAACVIFGFTIC